MVWLDIVVVIICIASCIRGYMTGFVMQLASLIGILLGIIFAGVMAERIYLYLDKLISDSVNVAAPLSYVIGFVVILVAVNLIGRIVNSLVKITLLGTVNRLVGAAFCLGKWILIVSVLLNLLISFDTNKKIIKEEVREGSMLYAHLLEVAQAVVPYLRFDSFFPSESNKGDFSNSIINI